MRRERIHWQFPLRPFDDGGDLNPAGFQELPGDGHRAFVGLRADLRHALPGLGVKQVQAGGREARRAPGDQVIPAAETAGVIR